MLSQELLQIVPLESIRPELEPLKLQTAYHAPLATSVPSQPLTTLPTFAQLVTSVLKAVLQETRMPVPLEPTPQRLV